MALEVDRIREIADRVTSSSGLELVDVELRGGGKSRMLRVFIDKPGGVTHEDCANVSRELGTILDVEDAVPGGSYLLEVSSPGLDRKLFRPADFERFAGNRIRLTTRDLVNGNRHFEGKLEGIRDGRITIALGGSERRGKAKKPPSEPEQRIEVDLSNIEKANLVPEI
jgi:ribosome maturation factor RimP